MTDKGQVESVPVFNRRPPEVYGSFTKSQQQNPAAEPGQSPKAVGSTAGNVPSPHQANEYDVIRDEGLRGGCASVKEEEMGSRGGVVKGGSQRMETRNVMYEDSEIKGGYHHPSVAVGSRPVFSGPVVEDYREPKDSYVTCRCKTKDLMMAFFIIVAVLLAVASLALSLLLWFGIYGGSDCSCPEEDQVQELQGRISALREEQAELRTRMIEASNNSVTHKTLSSNVSHLSTKIADINTTLLNLEIESDSATYTVLNTNVSLFESCERQLMDYCNVTEKEGEPSNCSTNYSPLAVEGTYLVDAFCAISIENVEFNTVTALLEDSNGHVRCTCTRLSLNTLFSDQSLVECRLYMSRCPETQILRGFSLTDLG